MLQLPVALDNAHRVRMGLMRNGNHGIQFLPDSLPLGSQFQQFLPMHVLVGLNGMKACEERFHACDGIHVGCLRTVCPHTFQSDSADQQQQQRARHTGKGSLGMSFRP